MASHDPLKKECYLLRSCLVGARRMLLFMVEQVFLLMGEVGRCMIQIYNAQERGERRLKGRDNFLFLNFFLSCHKI